MVRYIDCYKDRFGVEPICTVLPTAPSTYYHMKTRQQDPSRLPPRAIRNEQLKPEIRRVWEENYRVYGACKVWKQFNCEGIKVAHLMREMRKRGVTRSKKLKTTVPAPLDARPVATLPCRA